MHIWTLTAVLCCAVLCLCCACAVQGKRSLYLGAVGAGARMKLVVNMTMGSMMGEAAAAGSATSAMRQTAAAQHSIAAQLVPTV